MFYRNNYYICTTAYAYMCVGVRFASSNLMIINNFCSVFSFMYLTDSTREIVSLVDSICLVLTKQSSKSMENNIFVNTEDEAK